MASDHAPRTELPDARVHPRFGGIATFCRFPLIDQVRSYPTAIFLHSDGRVRAVHQGFTGPATGAAYTELREHYVAIVEELLAEGEHSP